MGRGIHRRCFLSGMGAAALAQAAPLQEIHLRIDPLTPDRTIPADFIGLGFEVTSVSVPGLLVPENSSYIQLLRTLSPEGVIRVGGNTSDESSLGPSAQAIGALGGFLSATGWKLIWGLNLGTGTPAAAADQAVVVAKAAGDRLLCFQIGNEPDLFAQNGHRPGSYGYPEYLQDFRSFAAVLRSGIPNAPLAGPDTANSPDWLTRFAVDEKNDETNDLRFLTEHYYRASARDAQATIANLLNPDTRLLAMLQQLPSGTRLCEVNSFSGGGKPGVSDTFASALWGLDLMCSLAAAGASGINFETGLNQLGFVSSYSPIFNDQQGNLTARPLYYAMLAFSKAGTGRLLDVQTDAMPVNFRTYATVDGAGHFWVTLINKDLARDVSAFLQLPGGFTQAEVWPLTAPSFDSTTGVTFAGAQVSPAGTWRPANRRVLRAAAGTVEVDVRAASAAVIWLGKKE